MRSGDTRKNGRTKHGQGRAAAGGCGGSVSVLAAALVVYSAVESLRRRAHSHRLLNLPAWCSPLRLLATALSRASAAVLASYLLLAVVIAFPAVLA